MAKTKLQHKLLEILDDTFTEDERQAGKQLFDQLTHQSEQERLVRTVEEVKKNRLKEAGLLWGG